MIKIDGHTHVSSIVLPEARIPEPEGGYTRLLIEMLDEAGLDRAVVMPIAPWDSNEMIAAAVAQYPDRLIGFASVDPNTINVFDWHKPVNELRAAVENFGLKGVKLNARVQNFSLRDPRVIPIFGCAADLGIPVLLDGVSEISPIMLEENLPFAVDVVARAVPEVKIIFAHMGGHRVLDGYVLAVTHANVYLDLSAILQMYAGSSVEQDLRFAIKKLAPLGKVIYGSDFPMQDSYRRPASILQTVKAYQVIFDELCLSPGEIDMIMGGTLATLLNLD